MIITFDKGGIRRQTEFGQPYQHKKFLEPLSDKKKFYRDIVGGSGVMLPQKILKITFSSLAETDFPGIKFTKKSIKTARIAIQSENLVRFSWAHEILPHACKTVQKSVSLTTNPQDLETMTTYIKYWFVKNITEFFTSFVLFFLYVLKS